MVGQLPKVMITKTSKLSTADSKRKRRKRRGIRERYGGVSVNRAPLPRSTIDQQINKNPEAPIITTKRWRDYW